MFPKSLSWRGVGAAKPENGFKAAADNDHLACHRLRNPALEGHEARVPRFDIIAMLAGTPDAATPRSSPRVTCASRKNLCSGTPARPLQRPNDLLSRSPGRPNFLVAQFVVVFCVANVV